MKPLTKCKSYLCTVERLLVINSENVEDQGQQMLIHNCCVKRY